MDVDEDGHLGRIGESSDSGEDSDPAFTSFKEMLEKGRGKVKAPVTRKKKVEELGPSGKSWTPLEKQARQ